MSSEECYTAKGGTRFEKLGDKAAVIRVGEGILAYQITLPLADLLEFARHVEGQEKQCSHTAGEVAQEIIDELEQRELLARGNGLGDERFPHCHGVIAPIIATLMRQCEVARWNAEVESPLSRRTEVLAMMAATIATPLIDRVVATVAANVAAKAGTGALDPHLLDIEQIAQFSAQRLLAAVEEANKEGV